MRVHLVVLSTTLSLLSRLAGVVSLVGSGSDLTAPLEDDSLFLHSEMISSPAQSNELEMFIGSSTNQPAISTFNQAASLFTDEAMLAENPLSHSVSENEFLLDREILMRAKASANRESNDWMLPLESATMTIPAPMTERMIST